MNEIRTKAELRRATRRGDDEIIVVGNLADELYEARNIRNLSRGALQVLTAAISVGTIAALPTGGLSLGLSSVALAPIVIKTGLSVEAILLIGAVGLSMIIALSTDYDWEYDFSKKRLALKKRYRG